MSRWRAWPAAPRHDAAAAAGARYADLALHVAATPGLRPGERRVPGRPQPSGVEVEAWKTYAEGDDLRHLDWSALARLDALLVRRFTAEREIVVHLLVDASASMADARWRPACDLVLALAAIGLASGHAVRLGLLRGGGPPWHSPLHRRAASVAELARVLDEASPDGPLDLPRALGEWAFRRPERAATVVVSDLLVEPDGLDAALRALRRGRMPLALLQVLGPAELAPEQVLASGRFVDAETGASHAVLLDPETLARHRRLLAEHRAALAARAAAAGAAYATLEAPRPVAAFVRDDLVRVGLVQPRRR